MSSRTQRVKKKTGSREDVWKGYAISTSGGLKKQDLIISKSGKIVSKKASKAASERMKKGKGLCEYCIHQYKTGKIKVTEEKGKKEYKFKEKKVLKKKDISKKRVGELTKEIDMLRKKAFRIAASTGKSDTKEINKLKEQINLKVKERMLMNIALKKKEKAKQKK